ncbi:hypothetical protein [Mycolicibacterium sarraceniae]|uniref:Uncharacterized protein n=1 Tax=Mycolicibacterium sarraceniae TaxID=1534348 RepID=A0A7I7SMT9_9MYCO|nr:hypothetical protein [Mycolicibacterium sarraceniae]BBY58297.1 hypothetical protein MSAR_14330 [Mycolicibacterium sarraceniae]
MSVRQPVDSRVESGVPQSVDKGQFLPTGDHLLPAELLRPGMALGLSAARKSTPAVEEKGIDMKKYAITTAIAGAMTAAVLGLAAPAQADLGHNDWVNNIGPSATAPHVDTTVHASR